MNQNEIESDPAGGKDWLKITVPACVVLIVLFLIFGTMFPGKEKPVQPLKPEWYTPKTARAEVLKNKPLVGNCFICHMQYIPDPAVVQPEFTHKDIKLNHGKCDRCYNCHLINDRNKYGADDGSGIMPTNVQKLCARCHGLIYNDWQNGTHGVWRGKWAVKTTFERKTFKCTQCHDPHSPRFEFKEFTPPPVWPDKFIRRVVEADDHKKTSG